MTNDGQLTQQTKENNNIKQINNNKLIKNK